MGNGTRSGSMLMGAVHRLGRLLLGLMLLALVQPVFTQSTPDQLVFGPKNYSRSGSQPVTVTDNFTVPSGVAAPFTLRIDNGSNGFKPVTAARVVLNGVEILNNTDFGNKVKVLERSVSLSG